MFAIPLENNELVIGICPQLVPLNQVESTTSTAMADCKIIFESSVEKLCDLHHFEVTQRQAVKLALHVAGGFAISAVAPAIGITFLSKAPVQVLSYAHQSYELYDTVDVWMKKCSSDNFMQEILLLSKSSTNLYSDRGTVAKYYYYIKHINEEQTSFKHSAQISLAPTTKALGAKTNYLITLF